MLQLIVIIFICPVFSQFDYDLEYIPLPESCQSRCGGEESGIGGIHLLNGSQSALCSCGTDCTIKKSCCEDYIPQCWRDRLPSCANLCDNEIPNESLPCQCGPICIEQDNCCPDYTKVCLMDTVSDEELGDIAESLLFWDENTASHVLKVNIQQRTDPTCDNDVANSPLFQMDAKFNTTTYQKLMVLYDDYIDDISQNETQEVQETVDIFSFITEVVKTPLMEGVQKFLVEKKFVTNEKFVETLRRIWFGLYSRQGSALGSSGFENVFLGETTSDSVLGFQNWVYFLRESEKGNVEYNGYIDHLVFNKKASVVAVNFKWKGKCKSLSTIFVGTSPEFEFALYTLCWFTRPNTLCPALLGGHQIYVQTLEEIDSRGQRFVASAHPIITPNSHGTSNSNQASILCIILNILFIKYSRF